MITTEPRVCAVCGKPENAHPYRHVFTPAEPAARPATAKGVVSQPGNAIEILTQDRDEWKRRAQLLEVQVQALRGEKLDELVRLSEAVGGYRELEVRAHPEDTDEPPTLRTIPVWLKITAGDDEAKATMHTNVQARTPAEAIALVRVRLGGGS